MLFIWAYKPTRSSKAHCHKPISMLELWGAFLFLETGDIFPKAHKAAAGVNTFLFALLLSKCDWSRKP